MTAMPPSPLQMVTLVSKGGTPVTLADQFGAPYPTTGTGPLVFADNPILTNVQFQGSLGLDAIQLGPGTAANPSISFSSDPTTGIYSPAPGQWAIAVDGVQKARVDSSGVTVTGNITYSGVLSGAYHDPLIARGDIYYYGLTGATRLPLGVAGAVLTSNGTDLVYQTPSLGIAIGSTGITNGTNGHVIFNNNGIAGEYPITGTAGSVVLSVSPALTGSPTSITPAPTDNSTTLATTAFVHSVLPTSLPPSGTASGDLSGSYPGPTIKPSTTNGWLMTTVAGVAAWAAPPSTAPSGPASGDLAGSFPSPTLAWISRTGTTPTLNIGAGGTLGSAAFTNATAYLPVNNPTFTGTLTGPNIAPPAATNLNVTAPSGQQIVLGVTGGMSAIDITGTSMMPASTSVYFLGTSANRWGGIWTTSGNFAATITSALGPINASNPAFSATQTWNNSGVSFDTIFANVTDTASASSSHLLRLQTNSSDVFSVDKYGTIISSSGFYNGGVVQSYGSGVFQVNSPIPVGGTQDMGLLFSTTPHFGLIFGSGAPTAVMAQGSWYMRKDATSAVPPFYFNSDGTATGWLPAGGGATVTVSDTAPTSPAPNPGAMWFNSVLGTLYIYYNDGNSTQWVPTTPIISSWPTFQGTGVAYGSGASTANGALKVDATKINFTEGSPNVLNVTGNVTASGDLHIANIYASGGIVAGAGLNVTGDGYITGNFQVAGGNGISYYGGNWFRFQWDGYRVNTVVNNASTLPGMYSPSGSIITMQIVNVGSGPTGWGIYHSDNTNTFVTYADYVSDARLKKDIVDTTVDALSILNAIPVRQFTWLGEMLTTLQNRTIDAEGKSVPIAAVADAPDAIGLVAQEVQAHIPEMVPRPLPNTNPDLPPDLLTIKLDEAIPYLIRAIQQLSARIVALEAKVP